MPFIVFAGSGRLGYHTAEVKPGHWHIPIFVLESVPHAVLVAQHPVGLVADPISGESKVPVGVR